MKKDILFIVVFCLVASIACVLIGKFLSQFIHLI